MQLAAVILAAGEASRFGSAKQNALFAGGSLLDRAVIAARGVGCEPIVVVSGAHALNVAGVEIVPNEQWRAGLGTSIRAGLQQVMTRQISGVILLTCDQPLVTAECLRRLLATSAPIAAAEYAGTIGVPAFFARSEFEKLLALSDGEGAKRIILSAGAVRVPMPEAAVDVDTPTDLAQLQHVNEVQSEARKTH